MKGSKEWSTWMVGIIGFIVLLAALLASVVLLLSEPPVRSLGQVSTLSTEPGRKTVSVTPSALTPPRITSPKSGDIFESGRLTLAGDGPAGLSARLYDGDRLLGSTVVGADGQWSLTLSEPLSVGDHRLTAVTADEAGRISAASEPLTITVAPSPLSAPVILRPATGHILRDGRPTLLGTAAPGSTVRLLSDGQLLGSVNVPADGNWTFTVAEPLAEGMHTLSALAEDAAGRISEPSPEVIVNVVSPPVTAPVILAPAREEVIQGQIPPLLGTAPPGATVWIFSGEQVLGTARAQADGRWAFRLPDPLDEGTHRLRAAVAGEAGRTSPLSAPVELRVLPRAMAVPVIISPAGDVALMQGRLTLSGVAQPGSQVEIRDGQAVLGTVQVGPDGRWAFSLPEPLTIGEHELIAVASDEKGRTSPPSRPVLARVSAPPPKPVATPIPVPAPVITVPVAAELLSSQAMTVTGTARPGTMITIYDGEALLGTVQVGDDGVWSLALAEPLAVGQHLLSAVARDETGRASQPSRTVVVEVILPPPLLPVTGGDLTDTE